MPPRRGGCLGGGRKSDQDNTSMYTPNAGTPQQPTTTNKLPSTLAARAELIGLQIDSMHFITEPVNQKISLRNVSNALNTDMWQSTAELPIRYAQDVAKKLIDTTIARILIKKTSCSNCKGKHLATSTDDSKFIEFQLKIQKTMNQYSSTRKDRTSRSIENYRITFRKNNGISRANNTTNFYNKDDKPDEFGDNKKETTSQPESTNLQNIKHNTEYAMIPTHGCKRKFISPSSSPDQIRNNINAPIIDYDNSQNSSS
ncbi:unnamed protein product [Rotaria socialis]|uniref:Uncharacterized protein n=1 Tax=Rotaria socialis TaxID=392032 RepID=A0A817TMW3_9BILA|nr:unnamed protein product [Rotaria socialis]CAF4852859.1 unnamed protein product [Rotaria socialis]